MPISKEFIQKTRKEQKARLKAWRKQKMLPFMRELEQSLLDGKTVCSFRYILHPFYPKAGEKFKAHIDAQEIQAEFLCRRRIKTNLLRVKNEHWSDIGVSSPRAYEYLMKKILKTEVLDYEKSGYLFFFERIL